ncbi:MAG: hypothetical protein JW697_04265, partial [Kosmotogaceae bacterium]|nr:hypothetical protein [Kosmotogaceae bacterium]
KDTPEPLLSSTLKEMRREHYRIWYRKDHGDFQTRKQKSYWEGTARDLSENWKRKIQSSPG